MLDAVAGEDRDRPLRREAAVDDPLRDAARDVARLGVGHPAPGAALPLGEEHTVGAALAQWSSQSVMAFG